MPHLDSELLLLIALNETSADEDELAHLGECAACREELASLTQIAQLTREAREVRDLPAPPQRVWAGIMAETGARAARAVAPNSAAVAPDAATPADSATADSAKAGPATAGPATADPSTAGSSTLLPATDAAQANDSTGGPVSVPPGERPGERPRGRRDRPGPGRGSRAPRRWLRSAALAAAAAVVAVVATIGAGDVIERTNQPAVTAHADLAAYGPTPAAAHGVARVLAGDGTTQLHIHVADLPPSGGYYEVWLIDPATKQMISLGVIGTQTDVLLPLPSTVDLSEYSLVDVSAEPLDGNPAHSGDSLLRGTLSV